MRLRIYEYQFNAIVLGRAAFVYDVYNHVNADRAEYALPPLLLSERLCNSAKRIARRAVKTGSLVPPSPESLTGVELARLGPPPDWARAFVRVELPNASAAIDAMQPDMHTAGSDLVHTAQAFGVGHCFMDGVSCLATVVAGHYTEHTLVPGQTEQLSAKRWIPHTPDMWP